MNELQKVIKYFAMAFAAFLAFTIVTGIVTALFALTGLFSATSGKDGININKSFENVKSLSVEHGIGTLSIKPATGDKVEVEAENINENFVVEINYSGELRIRSKFNFWNIVGGKNGTGNKSRITIYIPDGFMADKVKLDAGAGNIDIESLSVRKLDINAGAGNISGRRITAEEVKLDGGVGEITFEEVEFTDTDIDSGVGNIKIQGVLYGKNKIDSGVGEVTLDLTQSIDDFNLNIDKGLGSIYIDGEKFSNLNWGNRTADHSLNINGGVGDIDIKFQ